VLGWSNLSIRPADSKQPIDDRDGTDGHAGSRLGLWREQDGTL
jgi:hypothetical protein